jgi:acetyltransferase-like isoleucine patch superfamily enzyme
VQIGDRTSIAGQGTHIWSHRADPVAVGHALRPAEVLVGNDVYVGARATLLHCSIPDRAVVGAAAVVTKAFPAGDHPVLIAGNPGRVVKEYV